jgi:hypothetical protein
MRPEEEVKDVENKFEKKFEELAITYSKLQHLNEGLQNFSLAQKKLILEILSNGDEKILNLINENHEAFLALVETQGEAAGIKWDDLVIRFEWTFQIKEILENQEYAHSE